MEIKICRNILYQLDPGDSKDRNDLIKWKNKYINILSEKYSTDLYSLNLDSLKDLDNTNPSSSADNKMVDGRLIIRVNFDKLLENNNNNDFIKTLLFIILFII